MTRWTTQNCATRFKDGDFDLEDIHFNRHTVHFDEDRLNELIDEYPFFPPPTKTNDDVFGNDNGLLPQYHRESPLLGGKD